MSQFAKKEVVERTVFKPSAREAQELRENMKAFSSTTVNGRKQYPFELFLESQNIISFDKFGMIQVVNQQAYKKYIEINSLRQWIDEQEMEKMFQMYPEAREEYSQRIQAMFADIKSLFKSKTA